MASPGSAAPSKLLQPDRLTVTRRPSVRWKASIDAAQQEDNSLSEERSSIALNVV
jgi:hypothetical protein